MPPFWSRGLFRCIWVMLALGAWRVALGVGAPVLALAQGPRRLVVASIHSNPPYEYLDEEGRPTGFVNELIRAVAAAEGLDVEIRSMSFSQVREAFERGEVDIVSGMVFSEERAKSMEFSVPHSIYSYVLLTRKGAVGIRSERDCVGRDVLALSRSIMAEHLSAVGIAFRGMPTNDASILELAAGKGDAAIVPKFTYLYYAKKGRIRNLQAVPSEIFPTKRCFAVRKGEERLLAALNEGLFRLKENGTLDRIYHQHLGALEEAELPFSLILRRVLWILGPTVVVLGLLGLLVWSFSLRLLVRQRTAELNLRNRDLSERNHELETLDKMVIALNREMDLQPLMEKLLAGCFSQFPRAESGVLLLKDDVDGLFHTRLRMGAPLDGNEPERFTEAEALAHYTQGMEELGQGVFRASHGKGVAGLKGSDALPVTEAIVAMSLVFDEQVQGFLVLRSHSSHDAFDDAEVHTLSRFREHAIAAVAKAKTLDRLVFAVTQLRQVNEMKNQFFGIVAHDLRSPLNGIVLAAQCLEGEQDLELVEHMAQRIHREGMEMSALIGRLLDMARIDSGEMKAEPECFDIVELAHRVVERYQTRGEQKGITFVFNFSDNQKQAFADPKFIKEVLDNLVSNAVKFSPPGTAVLLRVERGEHGVITSVEDQGPGLTDQDKKSLFGRFARLSAKPTGGEKSTGLGLSIVKYMVEATGGRIWVDSEPGSGAAFRVELPISLL